MIKTRFAPSPTGQLHVGSLRTALYAYLFARKNKGVFILRVEDTDQKREVEGAMENLIKIMDYFGLEYDEGPRYGRNCGKLKQKGENGPYIQSQRTEIYRKYVQQLLDKGQAYKCFCTKERLDEMRERQRANKQAPMYDRKCCDLPESEVKAKIEAGETFVIRQKMPYEIIKFKDLIRGNVQFDGKIIDDQVLMKADGFPTYHLANVVDDHLMEITHVIRGEEWLPSTPKHIALYKSFGWEAPQFAHIPLLLNADKTKLSKRQGDVAVEEYMKKGYIKEAILNFIAFLGWNPGSGEEREIFTLTELEEIFSLEKVHKGGAVFNIEKLDWFNWQWQKAMYNTEFRQKAAEIDPQVTIQETKRGPQFIFSTDEKETEFLKLKGQYLLEIANIPENEHDQELLLRALVSTEEKILKDTKDTYENIKFFFELPEYDKELLTHEKMRVDLNEAKASLEAAQKDLEQLDKWTLNSLKQTLLKTVETLGVKNGQVLWPLRAALTGMQFSPGAFESAWTLGKEETIKRINTAIQKT